VFVRERIRRGDTTNFLRAASFFLSAISTAFLAEVATLYLLGIGNMAEPYYWLFILLTSIPFVLFSFLLVRFVSPLSFKDVLHLSFYPIGAGVFTGAALHGTARKRATWPRSQSRIDAEKLCSELREYNEEQRNVGCIGAGGRARTCIELSF
jgi:hypothetical protein